MSNHTTRNFSPDGHNGGFSPARDEAMSYRLQDSHREKVTAPDDDNYDDGLVHNHTWATADHR